MKPGTKIEVFVSHPSGRDEVATIARRTKAMGILPEGYHPVRFQSGGTLLVHEDGFRVLSDR